MDGRAVQLRADTIASHHKIPKPNKNDQKSMMLMGYSEFHNIKGIIRHIILSAHSPSPEYRP